MEDEKKIETTFGCLKQAFTKWEKDIRDDRASFISDDDFAAMSPEECGNLSAEYLLGLLEGQAPSPTPIP